MKDGIGRFFRKIGDRLSPEGESGIPIEKPEVDRLISHAVLSIDEKIISNDIRKNMVVDGNRFREIGIGDGIKGLHKRNIEDIAKINASFIRDHIKATFNGKVNNLSTQVALKENVMNRNHDISKSQDKFRDELLDYSRKYPKQHSITIFLLYIFIAIFLILADIPLALELTQVGFQLPSGQGDSAIIELFRNPVEVLISNWEVFVLSGGIALCAIYIKILYDEFIGSPIQSVVLKYRNIPGIDSENKDDINAIKREDKFRKIIKIFIFLFTITTIIVLGFFRFEAIANSSALAGVPQTPTVKTAFILITLLFPLIGGVCFSIALNNLQNVLKLNSTIRESKKKYNSYLSSLRDYSNTREEYLHIKGFVDDWNSSESIKKGYIEFLLACYEHGYKHGLTQSDSSVPELSLIERVEKMRSIITARNTFKGISKNNQKYSNQKKISTNGSES